MSVQKITVGDDAELEVDIRKKGAPWNLVTAGITSIQAALVDVNQNIQAGPVVCNQLNPEALWTSGKVIAVFPEVSIPLGDLWIVLYLNFSGQCCTTPPLQILALAQVFTHP